VAWCRCDREKVRLTVEEQTMKGVTVDEAGVSLVFSVRQLRHSAITMLRWRFAANRRMLVIALLLVAALWVWTGSHSSSSHARGTYSTFIGGGGSSGQTVRLGNDATDNSNSSSGNSGDDGGSAGSDGGGGDGE
jgi:hypothetical protein